MAVNKLVVYLRDLVTGTTIFLIKIRHENNNIALASPNFYSTFCLCAHSIPVYSIIHMTTFAEKLETIFNHSVKGAE